MDPLGHHLILEMMDCPFDLLGDPEHVARIMTSAVELSGATIIQPFFHQFAPQGVSGVIIISESHFTIHTWPEHGYAAVDIFTCGDAIDMGIATKTLRSGFKAGTIRQKTLLRGDLDDRMNPIVTLP
jgi:S-adenosylmethionine decarboxylase